MASLRDWNSPSYHLPHSSLDLALIGYWALLPISFVSVSRVSFCSFQLVFSFFQPLHRPLDHHLQSWFLPWCLTFSVCADFQLAAQFHTEPCRNRRRTRCMRIPYCRTHSSQSWGYMYLMDKYRLQLSPSRRKWDQVSNWAIKELIGIRRLFLCRSSHMEEH